MSDVWNEVKEPGAETTFYYSVATDACTWTQPTSGTIIPRDPANEWWELFDDRTQLSYFFNITTNETVWARPARGTILPLRVHDVVAARRQGLHVNGNAASSNSSTPASSSNRSTPDPGAGAVEASASSEFIDVQHAKLLPDWMQIYDDKLQRNYYYNKATKQTTWDRNVATGIDSSKIPTIPKVGIAGMGAAQKSSTIGVIKSMGVSDPILNKEATIAMSALNPKNYANEAPPSIPGGRAINGVSNSSNSAPGTSEAVDRPKGLPSNLQKEIAQFNMEGYAKKFFNTHKKGIFRRKNIPVQTMLKFSKDAISKSLLDIKQEDAAKEAVTLWKHLQMIMGDRSGTLKGKTPAEQYLSMCVVGVNKAPLRDELYVQLMKQLTENPKPESEKIGWEMMSAYVNSFPPSKNLDNYLSKFFEDVVSKTANKTATYCQKKLPRIARFGAKGKPPTEAEVARFAEAPFKPSVFGEALEDVMEMQKVDRASLQVPYVLIFLSDAVIHLDGKKAEGIFRVPGDVERVTELQLRIERNNYDLSGIADPSVPASLLKLWFRELQDPLIPNDLYSDAIKNAEDPIKSIQLVSSLGDLNRKVIFYLIKFLQQMADPANQPLTKMNVNNLAMVFAPSFLRCPSDNVQTIFENSRFEQSFVRNLIVNLHTGN